MLVQAHLALGLLVLKVYSARCGKSSLGLVGGYVPRVDLDRRSDWEISRRAQVTCPVSD